MDERPAMRLLSHLKLWQKLAILVGALLIPTAVACVFYTRAASELIAITRLEMDGGRYLQPLGSVLGEVMHHRGSVHAMLSGDASRKLAVTEAAAQVDRLMSAV